MGRSPQGDLPILFFIHTNTMKLTRWFPLSDAKPVREGVYNTSCNLDGQSGNWYCYWNGKKFTGLMNLEPDPAYRERNGAAQLNGSPHNIYVKSWRGIKKS